MIGIQRPYVAEVLAGTRLVDEQWFYNPRATDPKLQTKALLQRLRAAELDIVVLLTNSLRTGLLAWAGGAKQRIGYARYGRGPLLTHKLYAPRRGCAYLPTPAIDSYLQIAYAAGCPWESPRLSLSTLPRDEAAADAVWKKLRLPPGEQVVVFNSGGAFGAAKHWPVAHFVTLARRIVERGLAVLVNCGPAERDIARDIVRGAAHPRVVSLAEETVPIGLTKAVIRRSRLLVTTDSGPRFFGVAFELPVVTLFGPMHRDWSRTHYQHEITLAEDVPCGPCMQRICPLGHHRCMQDLSPNLVYAAVARLLEVTESRSRAA